MRKSWKKNLLAWLEKLNTELFPFSYSLIPDEAQAQQCILDAVTFFLREEQDLYEPVFANSWEPETTRVLKFHLYRSVFKMACQKIKELEYKQKDGEYIPYYCLPVMQRAVLYLKHKTSFSWEDMSEILDQDKTKLIELLYIGRSELVDSVGGTYFHGQ